MKKYLCVFLAVMMFCVIASGGCGGSSGGSVGTQQNQSQDVMPEVPDNGNQDNTNPEPAPDNEQFEVESLNGTWQIQDGTLAMTIDGIGTNNMPFIGADTTIFTITVRGNTTYERGELVFNGTYSLYFDWEGRTGADDEITCHFSTGDWAKSVMGGLTQMDSIMRNGENFSYANNTLTYNIPPDADLYHQVEYDLSYRLTDINTIVYEQGGIPPTGDTRWHTVITLKRVN